MKIWIPIELHGDDGAPSFGVSRDISRSGVLVSSAARLAPGTRVAVKLSLPEGAAPPRTTQGRVVRSGPNEDDPDGLWPFRLAIEFDAPIDGFDGLLDEMAASARGR